MLEAIVVILNLALIGAVALLYWPRLYQLPAKVEEEEDLPITPTYGDNIVPLAPVHDRSES